MKYAHIFTGPDGKSHFEDIEVKYKPAGKARMGSDKMKATAVYFTERAGESEFHNAPKKQMIVYLKGGIEIEASDGTKRKFGPGDIMLAEDKTGKGHLNRSAPDKPRYTLIIEME